ncbi:hypothetical protein MHBO_003229 [Bonamia ostreae]|uniref:Uncharacterized protein n=1 Tax=Bonamia ostreae TaxID=126728 RepID=A0ABV2APV3_9EUKA
MNEEKIVMIPLVAHENAMAREGKKLVAVIIAFAVVCSLLIGYIAFDRHKDSQSEFETIEYTAESNDSGHAVASGEGDVNINGESDIQEN